jgi:hypothetical protein
LSKRLISLAVGGLAIAMLAASCGGGGSETVSITKAEFVRKASAVCVNIKKQISSEFASYLKSQNGEAPKQGAALAAAEAEIVEKILAPNRRQEAEELRELGVPSEDGGQAKAISDALEEDIEEAEKHPKMAIRNTATVFAKSNQLATEYGLKEC